jgi:hypothetical protein
MLKLKALALSPPTLLAEGCCILLVCLGLLMEALPTPLRTDGESRGDAGNLIIVERLPTVLVEIVKSCYLQTIIIATADDYALSVKM